MQSVRQGCPFCLRWRCRGVCVRSRAYVRSKVYCVLGRAEVRRQLACRTQTPLSKQTIASCHLSTVTSNSLRFTSLQPTSADPTHQPNQLFVLHCISCACVVEIINHQQPITVVMKRTKMFGTAQFYLKMFSKLFVCCGNKEMFEGQTTGSVLSHQSEPINNQSHQIC